MIELAEHEKGLISGVDLFLSLTKLVEEIGLTWVDYFRGLKCIFYNFDTIDKL